MENTQETAEERTFEKWLERFRYFTETSGYTETLDEPALKSRFYETETSPYDAAVTFLREKGL